MITALPEQGGTERNRGRYDRDPAVATEPGEQAAGV
jgi:hypothetical protein